MAPNPFLGSWRITHMDEWGPDYLDLIVPAHITIERDASGSFQFGAVQGWLDYRVAVLKDLPRIEWSWQGNNDSDEACGRGWAVLEGSSLKGHIFIHGSDDSGFAASLHRPRRRPSIALPNGSGRGSSSTSRPALTRRRRA